MYIPSLIGCAEQSVNDRDSLAVAVGQPPASVPIKTESIFV
jgi:hypothetical protein